MTLEEYTRHLLAGEDEECLAAGLELGGDLAALHRLYVELIQPSQYTVGELWEAGRISVATEHMATAINTSVADVCYSALGCGGAGGPRAIVACSEGELHELGPRMLADLLECDGWDVGFLGGGTTDDDLIAAVLASAPRFIGLSAALVQHLGGVKRRIEWIREQSGPTAPPIAVGGNAFRGAGELWRQVGADLYAADASKAVERLRVFKG
jgi:MerR family transcriptional regulator, light-induced transcriptional regulator